MLVAARLRHIAVPSGASGATSAMEHCSLHISRRWLHDAQFSGRQFGPSNSDRLRSAWLATLIGALEKLRSTADHIHLRTPSNGGRELSEQTPWETKQSAKSSSPLAATETQRIRTDHRPKVRKSLTQPTREASALRPHDVQKRNQQMLRSHPRQLEGAETHARRQLDRSVLHSHPQIR